MTDYFHLDAAPDHIRAISNLGLAHLGDAVFEVMVRSWLCLRGKATSKGLHRATVHFVAAPAQAAMAEKITVRAVTITAIIRLLISQVGTLEFMMIFG